MGAGDDRLQTPTRERLALLLKTQASAAALQAADSAASERADDNRVEMAEARRIVQDWPAAPKTVGEQLLSTTASPTRPRRRSCCGTATARGPRTELPADEVVHDFPTPHTDFLTQYIDYPIDAERASDVVKFDGSHRPHGRTDRLPLRPRSVQRAHHRPRGGGHGGLPDDDEARELYGGTAAASVMGRDAPYAEQLLVDIPEGDTNDPDGSIVASDMLEQMREKFKDLVGEGDVPR